MIEALLPAGVYSRAAYGDELDHAPLHPEETAAVGQWVKDSPPAPGFQEVLLPGEPERRARARREEEGVPLDDRSLGDILAAARSLGLTDAQLDQALGR